MENMNHISKDDYEKMESKIDSASTVNELIKLHKNLVGKTSEFYSIKIEDLGVEFIKELFYRD